MNTAPKSVLLLGATGTIGQAALRELRAKGYRVIAPVRPGSTLEGTLPCALREADLTALLNAQPCQAVISCLASRSGTPADAWAIDHDLNSMALRVAIAGGATQFTLLSAICVQKPHLAFQHAKLAFEAELQAAPITWSIIRPTAYFKSLSGQLARLRAGKAFLLFGDGSLTACKPISNADLARYLAQSLEDPALQNRILPIGGPGPALTARAQGTLLFEALGLEPRFKHVPVAMMSAIIAVLTTLGRLAPRLREKAELARIGRYYATESMLVWDADAARYDADATPEFGSDTLAAHYRQLAAGQIADDRGDHAVF